MKKSLAFLVLVAGLAAGPTLADAVINIYGEKLKYFEDNKGTRPAVTKINRAEVKFPAAIISRESDYGLIMVRFEFKSGKKKPVIVWVPSRAVRIDTKVKIKVPGCAAPSSRMATVTRGVRGLGGGCR